MNLRHLLALPALLALAACGGSTEAVRPLPAPPPPQLIRPAPPAAIQTQRPRPHIQILPGLEGVIGSDADALTRQFGAPRLDVREGDVRKLQWSVRPVGVRAYHASPDVRGR